MVGPRAGLEECGKFRPQPGLDLRTVQAVASRYTDWVIPAQSAATETEVYQENPRSWKLILWPKFEPGDHREQQDSQTLIATFGNVFRH